MTNSGWINRILNEFLLKPIVENRARRNVGKKIIMVIVIGTRTEVFGL